MSEAVRKRNHRSRRHDRRLNASVKRTHRVPFPPPRGSPRIPVASVMRNGSEHGCAGNAAFNSKLRASASKLPSGGGIQVRDPTSLEPR